MYKLKCAAHIGFAFAQALTDGHWICGDIIDTVVLLINRKPHPDQKAKGVLFSTYFMTTLATCSTDASAIRRIGRLLKVIDSRSLVFLSSDENVAIFE